MPIDPQAAYMVCLLMSAYICLQAANLFFDATKNKFVRSFAALTFIVAFLYAFRFALFFQAVK